MDYNKQNERIVSPEKIRQDYAIYFKEIEPNSNEIESEDDDDSDYKRFFSAELKAEEEEWALKFVKTEVLPFLEDLYQTKINKEQYTSIENFYPYFSGKPYAKDYVTIWRNIQNKRWLIHETAHRIVIDYLYRDDEIFFLDEDFDYRDEFNDVSEKEQALLNAEINIKHESLAEVAATKFFNRELTYNKIDRETFSKLLEFKAYLPGSQPIMRLRRFWTEEYVNFYKTNKDKDWSKLVRCNFREFSEETGLRKNLHFLEYED